MSITPDGYVDWARRDDSIPRDKVYSQPNSGRMFACHSMVGKEGPSEDGIPARFQSTERDASGRYTPAAAASVMFILRLDGTLIQCFPIAASTWTSGSREANCNAWAMEAEGGYAPDYGEPLTAAQQDTFIRLITEWEAWRGVPAVPNLPGAIGPDIFQHRELAAMYDSDPTACASDRYRPAWERIAAGERYGGTAMTAEEKAQFDALVKRTARLEALVAGNGYRLADGTIVGGEQALEAARADGSSLFLSLGNTQGDVEKLKTAAATGLPDHKHAPAAAGPTGGVVR